MKRNKKIRVWIVDDNESYCILLSESLRNNKQISINEYFHSVNSILNALRKAKSAPDVVLLDIRMPGMSGIEGLPKILEAAPCTRVLMLSSHDDQEEIQYSLKLGASGYILKSSTAVDIGRAVERVTEGGNPLDPMITRKVFGKFIQKERSTVSKIRLTKRELDVIGLVVKGKSSDMIGTMLNVSVHTVTAHLKNIYKKLNVHSKHTLVSKAYAEGIVD